MVNPIARNAVIAAFFENRVKLPLRMSSEDVGVVLDHEGVDVLTVDSTGMRPDEQVTTIVALVVAAINQAAGFEGDLQS